MFTGLDALDDVAGASNPAVSTFVFAISLVFNLIGLVVVHAAVALAMRSIDEGKPVGAMDAYRAVLEPERRRRLLRTVLLIVAVMAPLTLSFFLIPIVIWLAVRWSLTEQVLELEGLGARASIARSSALVRGRWWRTSLLTLGVASVATITGPLVRGLAILGADSAFWVANLIAGIIYVFAFPFVAVVTTYIYYDRRVSHALEPESADSVLPEETAASPELSS